MSTAVYIFLEETYGCLAMECDRNVTMFCVAGLCGGVHSGVTRRIKRDMTARGADGASHKLVCVGDKSRSMLRRIYAPHMLISVKDVRIIHQLKLSK